MGSFERFKTKTHFNSLKRLVGVTALAALAVKLLTIALATAAGDGTPVDLLARVPASVADLGAALLVFEVLRSRRPLQLAARSAILVAVSPVLFVASGIHGDRVGVAVALLLLAIHLLVDRDAPLVAGITLAVASRVDPMALLAAPVAMAAVAAGAGGHAPGDGRATRSRVVHFGGALAGALFAAWVPTLAWGWDSLTAPATAGAGPGGLGPGWVLARSLDQGLAGWLLGSGRLLVLAAAVVPAVVWVRRRPRRVYAAVGLVLLTPLALGPAWSPRDLVWPAVFGYLGDARWASIYAVAAGATLLWTSTWWGSGVPWHGGVDPATVPSGAVAALGLVTWVVLGSWAFLGWRTVTVESGPGSGKESGSGRGQGWRQGVGWEVGQGRMWGLWATARAPVRAPALCPRTTPASIPTPRTTPARCRRTAPRRSRWGGGLAPPGGLSACRSSTWGPGDGPRTMSASFVRRTGPEGARARHGAAVPPRRPRVRLSSRSGSRGGGRRCWSAGGARSFASSLGGLGGGQRPVALVSLRVALGLPDRGPEGRILVAATRTGPVGFLVDEVVRVLRFDPASCPPETTRLSGYVTASFQALGGSWLLIDWDAIRLPAGITAPR